TPDIIQDVFGRRGFNDFQLKLTENYRPREYCVQYRETDHDFLCRLMEEDGIYFYFEHTADKHTMVLADSKSSHTPVKGLASVKFATDATGPQTRVEAVSELTIQRSLQTGQYALNEYDYNKPNASMKTQSQEPTGYQYDQLELYDYPGRYTETSDGDRFAKVRLEAKKALDYRRTARGSAPALVPGALIKVEAHPESSENIEHLIVRCSHNLSSQDYRSGGTDGTEYYGSYEFQPSDRAFRAPPRTPRPTVMGPQTAKVVGKEGEEIDVDEMGRILVQFHWDRQKDKSRRVRVAQTWSDKGWGAIMIPRIGQEVIIEYLEGDPDQPLCTGTVYNAEMTVPYELPANKTKNGFKSNSTKGGGGYNEFVFEDKKNSEEIGLHAQKDLKVKVLNTETREIAEKFAGAGASRTTTLKMGDDKLDIKAGNQKVDIAQAQNVKAGSTVTIEAGASITLKVGGSKIVIDPSGVAITGTAKVDINGGAAINAKAGIIKLN
ncbi:MAG: type VI secretion system tip protein TssI/VgrG, partial [Pseudomonadota bacterium]